LAGEDVPSGNGVVWNFDRLEVLAMQPLFVRVVGDIFYTLQMLK